MRVCPSPRVRSTYRSKPPGAFSETEAFLSERLRGWGLERLQILKRTDGSGVDVFFNGWEGDGARAVQHPQARGQLEVLAEVPTGLKASNPKPAFPRSPNFSPNRENEFSIRWWIPIPSSRPCIRTISKYLESRSVTGTRERGSSPLHLLSRKCGVPVSVAFPWCGRDDRTTAELTRDEDGANPPASFPEEECVSSIPLDSSGKLHPVRGGWSGTASDSVSTQWGNPPLVRRVAPRTPSIRGGASGASSAFSPSELPDFSTRISVGSDFVGRVRSSLSLGRVLHGIPSQRFSPLFVPATSRVRPVIKTWRVSWRNSKDGQTRTLTPTSRTNGGQTGSISSG